MFNAIYSVIFSYLDRWEVDPLFISASVLMLFVTMHLSVKSASLFGRFLTFLQERTCKSGRTNRPSQKFVDPDYLAVQPSSCLGVGCGRCRGYFYLH